MVVGNPGQMVPVIHSVGRSTGSEKDIKIIFCFSIWNLCLLLGEKLPLLNVLSLILVSFSQTLQNKPNREKRISLSLTHFYQSLLWILGERDHVCPQNPAPAVIFLINFPNINLETAHPS